MTDPDFQDRMFDACQSVYEQIENGELQGADAVEAALHDAHLNASVQ